MEKSVFQGFIDRFHVGGIVTSAMLKFNAEEKKLSCATGVLPDKNLLARVEFKEWTAWTENAELPFYEVKRLKKSLVPFGSQINVEVLKDNDRVVALNLSDEYSEARCVTCDPSVVGIKDWNPHKLPDFHVELEPDEEFVSRYLKACVSLSDENKGTVTPFTLVNKNGKLDLVINYSARSNTNRHCIHLKPKSGDLIHNLTFNSEHLKAVLAENNDAESTKIDISNLGFIKLAFDYPLMTSLYILTATKVGK